MKDKIPIGKEKTKASSIIHPVKKLGAPAGLIVEPSNSIERKNFSNVRLNEI